MRAIRQYEFGPPDVLRYESVLGPRAGAEQVLIAVEVAGVHVVDTAIRRGDNSGAFPLPALPMTPGREVAGVVEEVGPDGDSAWVGRRVVAHLGQANGGTPSSRSPPRTASTRSRPGCRRRSPSR